MEKYKNLVGTVLGKCRLVELCGASATGVVFRGHHEALDREVAVKILFPSPGTEYFLANSQKIVGLEHAGIVNIYDIAFDAQLQNHYIVEQWVAGVTLDRVSKSIWETGDALAAGIEIARALAYAHGRGVVHGDLTLPNVMQCGPEQFKIRNFSLIPTHVDSAEKPFWGTQGYAAPESGGLPPTTAGDVYNLGCALYKLLTGRLPAFTPGELQQGEASSDLAVSAFLKLPPHVPDPLASCLYSMLVPNPQKRAQEIEKLLLKMEELLARFNKSRCPRCGKKNAVNEVFRCKECGEQNLCLTHLVPERQCCGRCAGFKVSSRHFPRENQYLNLSHLLRRIANNNKQGVLTITGENGTVGVHIAPGRIDICLRDVSPDELEQKYFATASAQEMPRACERVVRTFLARMLEEKKLSAEFLENSSPQQALPQHQTVIGFDTAPGGFLIAFSQILRIYNAIHSPGALEISTPAHSATISFDQDEVRVAAAVAGGDETLSMIQDLDAATLLLESVLSSTCNKLRHRYRVNFAAKRPSPIPSPEAEFRKKLPEADWSALSGYIPQLKTIFPAAASEDRPPGADIAGISAAIVGNLSACFDCEGLQESSGLSSLDTFLVMAAIAKTCLLEAGMFAEKVEKHREKWAFKDCETVLLQLQNLCPDLPNIFYALGLIYRDRGYHNKAAACLVETAHFHWQREDIGLALTDYETAVQMDADLVLPKLRMMEVYEQLGHKDKVKEVGISLLEKLRGDAGNSDTLEKVCRRMLRADSGLAHCRRELIRLYLARKDRKAAIREYEALVEVYRHSKNKDAMAKAMAEIILLDRKRTDMERQLQVLGYDWRKLVDEPPSMWLFKFCKRALVAVIVLLFAAIAFREWMGRSRIDAVEKIPLTMDNLSQVKRETRDLALGIYLGGADRKALAYLKEITRREAETIGTGEVVVQRLWRQIRSEKIAPSLDRRDYEKVFAICREAEKFALGQEMKEDIEKVDRENTRYIHDQVQEFMDCAREWERKKNYAGAVDCYYKILCSPCLRLAAAARTISIPLLIKTDPVWARCIVDGKEVGETHSALLYRYRPDHFPKIEWKRSGYEELDRVLYRTPAENIWQVEGILFCRPSWEFHGQGKIGPVTLEGDTLYFGSRDCSIYSANTAGEKKWNFEAPGEILGGMLVGPDVLYFGTNRGDLCALHKKNAKPAWTFSAKIPIRSTPCFSGTDVCFASENGTLWFLSRDGKLQGKVELEGMCWTENPPVSYGKQLVFAGTSQGNIYAVERANFRIRWQKQCGGLLRGGPVLEKKALYCSGSDGIVTRFDLLGNPQWTVELTEEPDEILAVQGEYVFVGTYRGTFYCLDARTGNIHWQYKFAGDKGNPVTQLALVPQDAAYQGTVLEGTVLVSDRLKSLSALAIKDGNCVARWKTKEALVSHSILSRGVLYAVGVDGAIYAHRLVKPKNK